MATGPALRKLASHRSIHDGAFVEARDLTIVTEELLHDERMNDCLKAAKALAEHWEKRVIAHADAEEDGLYKEILEENPELEKEIHMLTRDHDLLRIILNKINEKLAGGQVTREMITQFHSLLVVNEIHSRSEESKLLKE
ncbi:hypothetical protein [Virgibacillus ndiopensis]|uniref:hypothetical protein n=1 Tax=Virgibacillus ndiopensis TaxID=2004408 RepID=UPI000C06E2DD|nr:hypothetical protein [Virgibacillus ndiopensis]